MMSPYFQFPALILIGVGACVSLWVMFEHPMVVMIGSLVIAITILQTILDVMRAPKI